MGAALEAFLRWALAHLDYVQVLLVLGGVFSLYVLYRLYKNTNNSLDLADLILQDGKASQAKLAQLGAFGISSWGFVYLTVHNQLTEWFYSSYMLAWAGAGAMTKWIDSRKPQGDGERRDGDPGAKE